MQDKAATAPSGGRNTSCNAALIPL
jgi:hypothetical protein